MSLRSFSSLALCAGLCWTACANPQYRRDDAGAQDGGKGGDGGDGSVDRRDMASPSEMSGTGGAGSAGDALDMAQDRPTDLPMEMAASDTTPRPDGGVDAPAEAGVDATTDVRVDMASPVDVAVERPVDAPLPAAIISIDFSGSDDLGASDTLGVVPAANWNSAISPASPAPGNTGTLAKLLRSDGSESPATVSWTDSGSAVLTGVDNATLDKKMMRTFAQLCYPMSQPDAGSLGLTVNVTGLPEPFVSRGFDVYVYTGLEVPQDDPRSWTVQAGSAAAVTVSAAYADAPFDGTYKLVAAGKGHYVRFNNLTGSSVSIKATPTVANRYFCSAINGVQLVSH